MNNKIYGIVFGGVIILNMLGFLMDVTWLHRTGNPGYFAWDIKYRGHIPFWLFADIVFLAVTLIAYFFFTGVRLHLTPGHANNYSKIHVKLMGVYLVLIPAILASFLLVSPDEFSGEKNMDDLLRKRIVYLNGYITQDKAEKIIKDITLLNARDSANEITLYINSDGGGVMSGLNIYDAIKYSEAPVTGIVQKNAASMAVIILQACKTRKAYKHSHMLVHNIKITKEWHKFEENLEEELKSARYVQNNLNRLIAERSGLSIDKIGELSRNGQVLEPEEAKELGLLDEII